jgi:hypothetical protein
LALAGGAIEGNEKVTDSTHAGSSHSSRRSTRSRGRSRTRNQFVGLASILVLTIGGALLGYYLGHKLAVRPLEQATTQIGQLQPENQRLKAAIVDQNAKLVSLQSRLTDTQKMLDSIRPAKDTYHITTNQSVRAADGRLTIGLVGPPTNSNIVININGEQHTVVGGDIIKLAPDPSTACQVGIQGFDMFTAIITASCAKAQ